jgi:hypothetical protein
MVMPVTFAAVALGEDFRRGSVAAADVAYVGAFSRAAEFGDKFTRFSAASVSVSSPSSHKP